MLPLTRLVPVLLAATALATPCASVPATAMPRLETHGDHHALIVDGRPYLVLGAQIHNSSNYPAMLPEIWPTMRALKANTIEAPVAWEQLEPSEGRFDYSWVDALVAGARKNDLRVVLLWFGAWKNGKSTYVPEWVKEDSARFPRLLQKDGQPTLTLSPFGDRTLAADRAAFCALLRHLRETDRRHTVILVQVENEIGTSGVARDYSAVAEEHFAEPVPQDVLRAAGKPEGSWTETFGAGADQAFAAWSYARYVQSVAAAGKAVYPLPFYMNAAVFDASGTGMASQIASGGPNWNVLPIWKSVAPSIDFYAPDLYLPVDKVYLGLLDRYTRPDNALFVAESSNATWAARFFWATLGRGAIGWSPFGMDGTDYSNYPLGARKLDPETLHAFSALFGLFRPIARDWAAIASQRPTWGTAKNKGGEDSTVLGRWKVTALYGHNNFEVPAWPGMQPPPWAQEPVGGGVVAQLGPDEFLVAGQYSRFSFSPATGTGHAQVLSAEEGTYVDGKWQMSRRWNGDQIDSGFNFNEKPALLRIRLSTY